jgi:hypothetical protein
MLFVLKTTYLIMGQPVLAGLDTFANLFWPDSIHSPTFANLFWPDSIHSPTFAKGLF